ncbi:MAG: hypothetical protein LCI03_17150, partial [Actinobacteria bacterium]|nr:hypothetical protein [Actinomycetota bacterium]
MRAGRRILAVAAAALVVTLVPALPAHAAAAVSITSPSNNANIWNASSSIAVSGDTGDPGDPADRIEVLANGNPFDTVTCGGTDQACTGSVPWNATGAARSTVFTAVLYGTLDTGTALDTSSAVTVNVVPPDPSITWSGLSNGQVGGAVKTISATGSTVSGDVRQPQTLQLVVDGVVVDSANCSANPCTTSSLTWDTPEVSGASYNVRVRLVLDDATTWPGDLVTVTTAAPTASVTQPANGANVTGTVTVGFSVATNANIGDVPDTVRLLIDGNATGTAFTCPGGTTHTCTGTFSWAPDNGSYAVSVRMTTVLGTQVVSTARTVNVNNLPSISITAPAA